MMDESTEVMFKTMLGKKKLPVELVAAYNAAKFALDRISGTMTQAACSVLAGPYMDAAPTGLRSEADSDGQDDEPDDERVTQDGVPDSPQTPGDSMDDEEEFAHEPETEPDPEPDVTEAPDVDTDEWVGRRVKFSHRGKLVRGIVVAGTDEMKDVKPDKGAVVPNISIDDLLPCEEK